MKLSVSAFQASCSASAQKILQHHAPSHNYGATSSCTAALAPGHVSGTAQSTPPALALRRPHPVFKVEEVEAPCSSPSPPPPGRSMVDSTGCRGTAAAESAAEPASGESSRSVSQEEGRAAVTCTGSALSSALPSLGTSREEEGHGSDLSERSSSVTGTRRRRAGRRHSPKASAARLDRSKSVGERHWANVRAVMALYARLRRIKRTKSNQRWMKLRTTVQLSGAISSTIQKKTPLKREDSFLKRFSTRQVAEQQETMDAGEDSEGGAGSGGGLMSQCAAKARRRRRHAQEKRSVVNPDENFYFYWLMVLTGCVLYNLWTLIVRQSFPELQRNIQPVWFLCDAFTDVIFLLDIVVQFRTGYLEQGLMVYNSMKLASHYMHSRAFLLDVAAMLPLDLLQFNLGINPILRFPRFLKVYRIYDYYYMVESRTVYPNLWRVVNLVHILLILAHWFGCFYFLLSEAENFQGEWVYPYRPGDYATLTRKYLGSLYWSTLTLTTIGDLPTPETNADGGHVSSANATSPRSTPGGASGAGQSSSHASSPPAQPRRGLRSRILQFNSNNGYIFTIVSYLIGVFIFATIVGQVGNVITNRNANRLEFERLLDGAKTYMRHHKVPGDMKRRVLRWYDYSWSRGRIQGGGDINTALGLLPDKLKTELALHVNLSVLKKVTIFQECQPEFLHDLVLKMKAYIFTPGDLICRKGEVAREMFIIADGILEVISETGRVLTTMKAGDFFGEIGILNLDGLNKRTADVRSVGYSELFSLSREDVLAAMKDYPEAQEILQSLGRKRLMEARNVSRSARGGSKRRGSGELAAPVAGDSSDSTSKRIVDKLRSDVKGLKNVLRKSRRSTSHSSKEDSMELQPLTRSDAGPRGSTDISANTSKPPRIKKLLLRSINVESSTSHDSTSGSGSGGKAKMLRRMGRVRSDEATEPPAQSPAQPEVIGAGLPLLQRLLLLKAKEDREEREQAAVQQSKAPVVPTSSAPAAIEVVGAGLPLMARLRLLKQREEAAAKAAPLKSPSPQLSTDCSLSPPSSADVPSSRPWPLLVTRLDDSSAAQTVQAQIEEPPPYESPPTVPSPALKSPIIVTTPPIPSPPSVSSPLNVVSPVTSPPAVFSSPPSIISPPTTSPQPISPTSPSSVTSPPSVMSPPPVTSPPSVTSPLSVISPVSSSGSDKSPKPSLLSIRQDTKFYKSIDDLSPEYSGLPFVKKLKILNERQKLAALVECTATVRSSSLDSGNTPQTDMFPGITRSRSEACDIDYVQRTRGMLTPSCSQSQLTEQRCDSPPSPGTPPSPECNETLERRNLKSILKKLSSSSEENKDKRPASKLEFRRLLRAQTVEGYAARHSKFAKSVTFNRDSVSPPPPPTTQEAPQTRNKMNFLLPSLLLPPLEARKEEEFFGDVITGMKTVLQNHMEEIQSKFQLRFQSLELEVRRRDEIISQLQRRIQELESTTRDNTVEDETLHAEVETAMRNGGGSEDGDVSDQEETTYSDQPFMRGDSVDTVVTPSNSPIPPDTSSSSSSSSGDTDSELETETHDAARGASWEERSEEESLELLELPRSLSPQALWQHVALDVASSGSSSSSSSPPPGHNRDWEVQMLADELDRRDQRCRLEDELAELAGKSRFSRSELDILDRMLQESARSEVKNRSFDEDHASPRHRRRNTSESSCSVEHLNVMRTDTMRASLLRHRLPHHKKHEESGLVSWLHRKTSHQSQQQQSIGKQYLNARSLEEPAGSVERPPPQTQGRSSSIGHLPVPSSSSGTRHSLFGFSRLRLSTLSHSLRGFTRPASTSQTSSSETVATISLQPPEPPS